MEQDAVKLDSLPALLPGSEYKTNDLDEYRALNLLGQAIAIVVRAEQVKAAKLPRETWFNIREAERKKSDQYSKKLAEFKHRHDPSYAPPDMNHDEPYDLLIRGWLYKSLFINLDWDILYFTSLPGTKPSDRHHSEWWSELRNICRRAQTSIDSSFDPIKEIQRISEQYQLKTEKPAEREQKATSSKWQKILTCVTKIPRRIYYIFGALAALLTVLHLLGCLQPLKDFVSKIIWP